ncbi:MAG: outer membrane beta-barrel protein [Pseudomonadota bacterium]
MIRSALTALPLALALPLAAQAADLAPFEPAPAPLDETGFYVSAFGGASFFNEYDSVLTGAPAGQTVEIDFDTGFNLGAAVGYDFGNLGGFIGYRAELELSYYQADVDSIAFSGNGPALEINVDGDVSTTNIIANVYGDLEVDPSGFFTPYLGVGLGVAFTDVDAVYGANVNVDGDEESLIAQAIAGVNFDVHENVDLFAEGRYARIFDVESTRVNPNNGDIGFLDDDVDILSVNVGVRFNFY